MNNHTDISLTTEEGHVVKLSHCDFNALIPLPNLDMTRLMMVSKEDRHAKHIDGSVHP